MSHAQPTLKTRRLHLLPAETSWASAMLDFQLRNREHLAQWDPVPGDMFYTQLYWTMRLRQRAKDWLDGYGAAFLLMLEEQPGQVVGSVALSNVVRGRLQSGTLSYALDASLQGQGLMREALEAVIALAFDDMRLHRIQANYQSANLRSAGLLQRLGFRIEGEAKDYLYINGAWRDHVLTARCNPDFDASQMIG